MRASPAPGTQYTLTEKQVEAIRIMNGPARHILLRGGARSGKTFVFCRNVLIRAGKAPESTHAIFRQAFNHLKLSIISGTMPMVAKTCFPNLRLRLDKTDWFHELPNGARVIYGGLDDKERTEKILGQEHATIALNEASQITYASRNKALTRLAQKAKLSDGTGFLTLKAYYDCNPPTKAHWTHGLFIRKVEPTSGEPLENPDNYATLQMNPADNPNLAPEYLEELRSLPAKDRLRFEKGEFLDQVDNALWTLEQFQRIAAPKTEAERDALLRRMRRVVVAIDPSGSTGPEDQRSDEVGIVVAGVDDVGAGYVLEDASGQYSPEGWAALAVRLLDKWQGDTIIGEINYGGDMVRAVVQANRPSAPFKKITASRGKHVRAEPIAAMYEQTATKPCRVVHVGRFPDLEEQLCNFSTSGYEGPRSPDRGDAMVFALTELMIGSGKRAALF